MNNENDGKKSMLIEKKMSKCPFMQNYSDISKNEQRFFVPFQLTQKLINYCKNILKVYGMTL